MHNHKLIPAYGVYGEDHAPTYDIDDDDCVLQDGDVDWLIDTFEEIGHDIGVPDLLEWMVIGIPPSNYIESHN